MDPLAGSLASYLGKQRAMFNLNIDTSTITRSGVAVAGEDV
jgi:hypothetical protein